MQQKRDDIRNIAIIAHVDHGKTTLVDAMLRQTHTVKDSSEGGGDLIMDSMDLERERGITIKAKNASVVYNGVKINIIDTPGHADFGGEVERTLKMADGVLLLVDAKEGPMPQTKFVLRKALELGHRAIVVINKIDRADAQIDEVINKTFDLFVSLKANDAQLNFPIIYASAINGIADTDMHRALDAARAAQAKTETEVVSNLTPLFETIIKEIPAPTVDIDEPFAMLVLALNYDSYKGKMGTGKIHSGKVSKAQNAVRIKPDGTKVTGKITSILAFQGLAKIEVQEALAGDIVSIGGFDEISIGETIADAANPVQLPPVSIEEPTVRMTFAVNNGPFAGKDGKFVTSRNIRERLMRELETNVALRVEETGTTDSFLVSGRGELHLGILIETMRREGFELQVSQPEVIYKTDPETGVKMEPYEILTIDVPSQYQGPMIEELGKRGGDLKIMETGHGDEIHAEYVIPTRGLIGLKNLLLTKTRGTAILNNLFDSYQPAAPVKLESSNSHGSLIAAESGVSNAYGLNNAQERGTLFIGPAVEIYEGMIVGRNAFDSDLEINVAKTKRLSNMRSSGADDAIILTPPKEITLDFALEYIGPDELVEVTPKNIRLRKRILNAVERKRFNR